MGSFLFCLSCSISAVCPTQSGFDLRGKHWAVQEICACRTVSLISRTVGVQQSAIILRQLPAMQLLPQRERFPSPLCPSCSWNHVCVKSLPSEVLTYLLLSSAHIFSWPRTSSRPSGWPWHTHRTSSLSFLLKETAVQRDSGASQTFYMQSSKKNLYFAFYNSAVHFTLDPSWCLLHICGIWDCSVKAAFLEGISDAWVAVALTSPAIMFHTPWWRKRKGIWISNMDSPWNTLWVQQKVLHWPFLQPPHSPKFLLLLSECYMSVGICAMCNTTIHKQLFSLAEFHTHPVHCLSPLKVVCRTCNYGPIIHKYDIVRFLGSKMSKIKRLYFFI